MSTTIPGVKRIQNLDLSGNLTVNEGETVWHTGNFIPGSKVDKTTIITAGNGLIGGGDLSVNRTLSINYGGNGSALTVSRSDHDHNSLYYTQSEVTSFLSGKSDTTHLHDDRYYTETEADTLLAGKSDTTHLHDDRYYTESEIDSKLAGKSDTTHNHDSDYVNVTGDTMTGKLSIQGPGTMLELLANNQDTFLRMGHLPGGYGFDFKYTGTEAGNENSLELWTDGALSTNTPTNKVFRVEQDGIFQIVQDNATINGNIIHHAGNFDPSLKADKAISIIAGNGLTGGGDLSANRTLSVSYGGNGSALTVSRSDHNHDTLYYTQTEVTSLLGGKSDTSHLHDDRYYTESEIDTLLLGKSDTTHTHSWTEITSKPTTFEPSSHTHPTTEVTGLSDALAGKLDKTANAVSASKWATARTVKLIGDVAGSISLDGSVDVNMTTTVADDSHNHTRLQKIDDRDVKPVDTEKGFTQGYFTSLEGLTGTPGTDYQDLLVLNTYTDTSGGKANALSFDKSSMMIRHYQAVQTDTTWGTPKTLAYTDSDITGNAATATKLTTARTISLNGDISGSGTFDGSGNLAITTVVADDSHNHIIANVDGLQTALDGKAASSHTHLWSHITDKPATFAPSAHTHDDRYYTETEMDTKLASKSDTTHLHDDRYYTESESDSRFLGISSKASDSDKLDGLDSNDFARKEYTGDIAIANSTGGWYTIAKNGNPPNSSGGDRASAQFVIRDTNSGDHQTVHFIAGVHFGVAPDSEVSVLNNSAYGSNGPFKKIRMIIGGTYAGARLQVYVQSASATVQAFLYRDIQSSGWTPINWVQEDEVPTGYSAYEIDIVDRDLVIGRSDSDKMEVRRGGKVNATGGYEWNGQSLDSRYEPKGTLHDDRYYTETEMDSKLSGKSNTGHTHLWADITDKPSTFTPSTHNHDDRYYTETEIDTKLGGKSDTSHTHSWTEITSKPTTFTPSSHTHSISDVTGLQTALNGKSDTGHTHDDRYYTESEMDTKLSNKVGYGDVIMNTNSFGGNRLFINSINNAMFRAESRWIVKATVYSSADGSVLRTLSEEQLAQIFDGNYESTVRVNAGEYIIVNINFNGGNFPGYPYGYLYVSYYYDDFPVLANNKLRVYCNYEPHGIGWHEMSFTDFNNNGTTNLIQRARNGKYNISEMEFEIHAPSDTFASITQIDYQLDRPGTVEMPLVDKYRNNNLFSTLFFRDIDNNQNAYISNNGSGEFKSLTVNGTAVSLSGHTHDDRYYTESEMDTKLAGKSATGHTHSWGEITDKPNTFTPSSHTHAISEVTGLQDALDGKSATSHTHSDATTTASGFMSATDKVKVNSLSNLSFGSMTGFGGMIHFNPTPTNSDPAWMGVRQVDSNTTRMYINIGDDNTDADYLAVTTTVGDSTGPDTDFSNISERIKLTGAGVVDAVGGFKWNGISLDSRYAPLTHTHVISDITNLQSALDGKSGTGHTHAWGEITNKPSTFTPSTHNHDERYYTEAEMDTKISTLNTAIGGKSDNGHTHTWSEITLKPTEFTPATHTHPMTDIVGLGDALDGKSDDGHTHGWTEITGKPTTFTPASHTHLWSHITDKPTTFTPSSHTHLWSHITDKPTTFAPSAHTHLWADITDKPTSFVPASHTHTWGEITNKPDLDNYVSWKLSANTETTPVSVTSGATVDFKAGSNVSISRVGNAITISSTDTNTDTNNYVTSASSTDGGNGTLTLTRSGLSSLTVNLAHSHDASYLGKTAKAVDSDKLDGHDSSYFAVDGHTHTSLRVPDTRSVVDTPLDIPNNTMGVAFKSSSSVDNPPVSTGSSYSHILNMNGWNSGNSGGGGHTSQLAFGDGLAIRVSTSTSTWGAWRKVWHDGNFTPSNYVGTGADQSVGNNFTIKGTTWIGDSSNHGDLIVKGESDTSTIHLDGNSAGKASSTATKVYIAGNGNASFSGTVGVGGLTTGSTALVTNLNAEMLNGKKEEEFVKNASIADITGYGIVSGLSTTQTAGGPSKDVYLNAGVVMTNSGKRYAIPAQIVNMDAASTDGTKIAVMYIRGSSAGLNEGKIAVATGLPAANPTEPSIPGDAVKLSVIRIRQSVGTIHDGSTTSYDDIDDARQWRTLTLDNTSGFTFRKAVDATEFKENGTALSSKYARLGAANTFSGDQSITGKLSVTHSGTIGRNSSSTNYGIKVTDGSASMLIDSNEIVTTNDLIISHGGQVDFNNIVKISSVGMVTAPKNAATITIPAGQTSVTWTHNYGATSYAVNLTTNSFERHIRWTSKNSNNIVIEIDNPSTEDILVDCILIGY